MLTASKLRQVISYSKSTGLLRWRERTSNRIRVGSEAGSKRTDGFRKIVIGGKSYLTNRIAVLYVTGRWPTKSITHRNGDRADVRWRNIRAA